MSAYLRECVPSRFLVSPQHPNPPDDSAETVSPDEGFIEFYVTLSVSDQKGFRHAGSNVEVLKERSRFVREGGVWLYRDGKSVTVAVLEDGGKTALSADVLALAEAASAAVAEKSPDFDAIAAAGIAAASAGC